MILTNNIRPDAEVINSLGVIRGSIQRMVKLELAGINNDETTEAIDTSIEEFSKKKIKVVDQNKEIYRSLDNLHVAWIQLKEAREAYRKNPSIENQRVLIEKSEELWEKSNNTVYESQVFSERKMEKYNTSFIFFLVNILIVVLIVFLIKRYVKDNLEYLVCYDGLTKIYNRRYFNEYLSGELKKAERYQRCFSLIMFDIDHFKRVNDTYGHDAGDSVLKELSWLIQTNIRKSDVLSRLGGEEFGILAPETGIEDAFRLSEKLRGIVEENTFKYAGKITISLGVAQFNQGDSIDSIYKRADNALYCAKNNGRNRSEIEDNCSLAE